MSVAPELQRERDHLARARAELARMREQTLSLEAHGGDRDLQRVPRLHAAPPGPVPGGRPDLDAVLRPDRPPG